MKTVEEWLELEWTYDDTAKFRENIKQIQLDAFKAGMTESAEIATLKVACWSIDKSIAACAIRDEILSARDRKESV